MEDVLDNAIMWHAITDKLPRLLRNATALKTEIGG